MHGAERAGATTAGVTDRTTPQLVELKLTNTNESLAAAFKFRTNAPTRYTVKPVIGVIAAGGVATVHSTRDGGAALARVGTRLTRRRCARAGGALRSM